MDGDGIKEHLICPVCMEIFDDPRSLPCGHTFCCPCLGKIISKSSIECPVCRHTSKISVGGAKALPKNHPIADLADSIQRKNTCQTHRNITDLFCRDCDFMVCRECLNTHVRHMIENIDSAYRDEKGSIGRLLDDAKSTESKLKEKVMKCGRAIQVLEKDKTDSETAIMKYFKRLREQIESKNLDMIKEVQQVFDSQLGGYRDENSTVSDFQATFRDVQREYGSISSSDKLDCLKKIRLLNQRLTESLTKVRNLPVNRSYEVRSAKCYPCNQNISKFLEGVQIHRDDVQQNCDVCGIEKKKEYHTKENLGEMQQMNSTDCSINREMASKASILVVAIDFGNNYSGCASSFKHEYHKDPTKICVKMWSDGFLLSTKTSTTVLIKPDGKTFHSFGYQAEEKYAHLAFDNDDEQKRWYYFRHFKTMLHGKREFDRNIYLEDETQKSLPAKTVFSLAIGYLKDDMLRTICDQLAYPSLAEDDITWVLTVPAIWTDTAKQFMREAAAEAGIKNQYLKIAPEPEAAFQFCRLLPVERMVDGIKGDFKPFSRHMVLDAGDGTADMTVYEVLAGGRLKELHKASIGACGGTQVEAAYKQFIVNLVGNPVFHRFHLENKEDYLDMFREFEIKMRDIAPHNDNKVTIRLPSSLKEIFEDECGEDLRTAISQTRYANEVSLAFEKLRINAEVMKSLFSNAIQSIVSHVKELMKGEDVSDLSSIMMVGGFSESKMLQDAIRSSFPYVKVIIPTEAKSAVLYGAVVFGHSLSSVA